MNPNDEEMPTSSPARSRSERSAAVPGWVPVMEQLAREVLRDRRRERRWRWVSRLMWISSLLVIGWLLFGPGVSSNVPNPPHTALVEVKGEIVEDSAASAENLIAALRAAFEDEASQAVVLRFNSPGGSPVQAGMINDEIRRLKAIHQKKVYAVIEESCASGAYYIAAAADEIYTDKASVVGSIGVLMDGFGFTGAMEKFGVERRLMTAGEDKAMGDPFLPMSEAHRQTTQRMLDQIPRQFIRVVREGRGNRLKVGAEAFTGRYWNGEEAVEMGLADHLGSLDYVAREVVRAADIIDYTPKESVAERFAKRFGASVGSGMVRALGSTNLR